MIGIAAALAGTLASGAVLAPEPARIDQVSWLTGCWLMDGGAQSIEERWTPPLGGSMLGTSRTVRNGRLAGFEFVLLRETDGGLVYEAHPSGQAGETFPVRELTATRVTFENPAHDFPQRIVYELRGANGLAAWIEGALGGKPRRVDFTYRRVPCP